MTVRVFTEIDKGFVRGVVQEDAVVAAPTAILADDAVESRRGFIEFDPRGQGDTGLSRKAGQAIGLVEVAAQAFVKERALAKLPLNLGHLLNRFRVIVESRTVESKIVRVFEFIMSDQLRPLRNGHGQDG